MGGAPENLFKNEAMINDIKEVMPHFSEYLDKWGISGAAGLAKPLRELLFDGLRSALLSNEVDVENVAGSNALMKLINELDQRLADETKR